jgi:hypothetical protein
MTSLAALLLVPSIDSGVSGYLYQNEQDVCLESEYLKEAGQSGILVVVVNLLCLESYSRGCSDHE